MRILRIAILGLGLSAVGLSGCYYQECQVMDARAQMEPAYVRVSTAPPPLRVQAEVVPARPHPQGVWVGGHWAWQGGTWVWVDGRWEVPRPGWVWTQPSVTVVDGGYRYHPGYWRPHRQRPPRVYVRPAVPVAVPQQPQGGGTVVVRPAQPQPPQGGGTVVVRPAQPQPPRGGGTVVVTPAQPPRGGGAVVVTPAQPPRGGGGAVVVTPQNPPRGGGAVVVTPAQPPRGGGAVVVTPAQPPRGGGGAVVVTPQNPPRGGRAVVVTPGQTPGQQPGTIRPGERVPPAGGGVTITPGQRPGQGTGTVRPPQGGGGVVVTPGTTPGQPPGQLALQCRVQGGTAMRGATLTITGSGWGSNPVIRIGGLGAAMVSQTSTTLVVQAPRTGAGGNVRLTTADGREAVCGNVRIIGGGGGIGVGARVGGP